MLQVVINIYWVTAWLKIHEELPWWYSGWESACQGRGTRIQSQIWEDPMCWEAAKSGSHTCWRPCLEPVLHERGHRSCDKDCPCSLQPELRCFSWSRIQSEIPYCVWWGCLFSFLHSVTVSHSFMILFLTLWKTAEHWRTFLNLDLSEFRQFGPENHRSAVGPFWARHTRAHVFLLMLTIVWLRWCLPGFSTVQFSFFLCN